MKVLLGIMKDNLGMHVSRYKQWEVLPASKFSGQWFKFAVGNELLESFIIGTKYTDEDLMEYEKQGYQIIDIPRNVT